MLPNLNTFLTCIYRVDTIFFLISQFWTFIGQIQYNILYFIETANLNVITYHVLKYMIIFKFIEYILIRIANISYRRSFIKFPMTVYKL